jgi:hypothetical protein
MRGYDYYENELDHFMFSMNDTASSAILDVCTRDTNVESYRFGDSDEVCDDGRTGYRV